MGIEIRKMQTNLAVICSQGRKYLNKDTRDLDCWNTKIVYVINV